MFLDTKIHLAFHAFGREIMKVGLFLMSAKLAWRKGEGVAELAEKRAEFDILELSSNSHDYSLGDFLKFERAVPKQVLFFH